VPAWLTGGFLPGGLLLNSGFPDVCVSVFLVFC
jgi:hypothetical protein